MIDDRDEFIRAQFAAHRKKKPEKGTLVTENAPSVQQGRKMSFFSGQTPAPPRVQPDPPCIECV